MLWAVNMAKITCQTNKYLQVPDTVSPKLHDPKIDHWVQIL